MQSFRSYKLRPNETKQPRPVGIGILATVGVLGSLATILVALDRVIVSMRVSLQPSAQLAVLGAALTLALVSLWINWGFWELIRWAWWANLLLTVITIGGLVAGLRFVEPLGLALTKLRPDWTPQQLTSGVLAIIVVGLVYNLIVVLYMLSVRTRFGVGVKDQRPIWQRASRR
jgi:hypothetical protein